MAVLRHALSADAGPTPHAAVMAVPVPAAMDRRERPLVDTLKARQGRLRWSRLAARGRGEGEACCDRESAKPGQHFLHRCPPLSFILKARSLGRSCRRSNQHRGGRTRSPQQCCLRRSTARRPAAHTWLDAVASGTIWGRWSQPLRLGTACRGAPPSSRRSPCGCGRLAGDPSNRNRTKKARDAPSGRTHMARQRMTERNSVVLRQPLGSGEPGWDRTNDHLIKSQMLYR